MNIDRLIHSPARLSIMTQLMVVESADATWLKGQTDLSWGNLATHIQKLEEVGYVTVKKDFVGKKPRTVFRLSKSGIEAFEIYKKNILEILQ
jgi:DNA-binding MarR family transcriptional regulator